MSETTFQDTPLYAWLRANAWFLLAGVAVVGGILAYRNMSADGRLQAREDSWDRFGDLASALPEGPSLSSRLADARSDPRIHPWVVLASAREAAQSGDAEAIALLRPELQSLAADERIRVATAGGSMGMPAYILTQLDATSSTPLPRAFDNPEPTGRKIEIVVSTVPETTYTIIAGIYEEQCPNGTAALVQWIEGGRLAGQSARMLGVSGLTMSLVKAEVAEGAEPPPAIVVERPYGLFHEEGTISMLQLPGQFGAQDPNSIQLILMDQFSLDGQATVLGKVLEGFPQLKAALAEVGPTVPITVVSARLL